MRDVRGRQSDAGFTLVEMSVVMVVLTVVLGIIFGVVLYIQREMVNVSETNDAVTQARLAIMAIDRQVRSGNVLYDPQNMSMLIYTQANGDQKCVQWRVEDQALQTRSWEPVLLQGAAPAFSPWRTIATGVINSPDQMPFSLGYQSDDPTADQYRERLLNVRIIVSAGKHAKPVEVATSLSGRNTHYGYNHDRCQSGDGA